MTTTAAIPFDLDATERGNIWLTSDDGHNAWIRLDGDRWLQIAIRPENYPGLIVNTITATDDQLAAHINNECEGMVVRKMNIEGVQVEDNIVVGTD